MGPPLQAAGSQRRPSLEEKSFFTSRFVQLVKELQATAKTSFNNLVSFQMPTFTLPSMDRFFRRWRHPALLKR